MTSAELIHELGLESISAGENDGGMNVHAEQVGVALASQARPPRRDFVDDLDGLRGAG